MTAPFAFYQAAAVSAIYTFFWSRTGQPLPHEPRLGPPQPNIVICNVDDDLRKTLDQLNNFEVQLLALLRWEYDQSISWKASAALLPIFGKSKRERIEICLGLWSVYSRQASGKVVYKEFRAAVPLFWDHLESLLDRE